MDNWFTSIKLALKLMTEPRCMGVVGTIRTNRKGVPKKAIYQKRGGRAIDRGSMKVHKITINGKDLFLTAWKDNKEVHVVSTFMPNRVPITRLINNNGRWERKRFFCPTSVKQYNMKMGGVDKMDQYASYYDDRRRVQSRWQPRVERRAMKNSLINACILFNDGKETATPLLDFIKNVVTQWGSSGKSTKTNDDEWEDEEDDDQPKPKLKRRHAYTWQRDVTQRLTGPHFPQMIRAKKISRGRYHNPRVKCLVCKSNTVYKCKQCDVFLCIEGSKQGSNCWEKFHSHRNIEASKRQKLKKKLGISVSHIFSNSNVYHLLILIRLLIKH